MDRILQKFVEDTAMIDTVRNYLDFFIKNKAGDMALNGDDVSGVKNAKTFIDQAFGELIKTYTQKVDKEVINESL